MIQNKLFRDCLAAIPAEQKAEFDLSFGIAERISEILKAKGLTQKDFARLQELIAQYQVGAIVVGLPKNMNGTIGPRAEMCQSFGKLLQEKTSLPVHMWDERLTTMAAERMLISADVSRQKRKTVIDKMAATLILQGYLDAKSR